MTLRLLLPALCLALLAPAAALAQAQARPDLRPTPPGAAHAGETKCGACHSTESWGDVAFAHERTGFPLVGGHKRATCKQCHPQSFSRAVSHECSACHRDPHRGRLGARCRSCHDEDSWKSRFDADAHRRAGFPLQGRHAFLPCESCHGDRLNRGLTRATGACQDCHGQDLLRANAKLAFHSSFGTGCKDCHTAYRFTAAFFPAHERCFSLGSGPHTGIACADCHQPSLPAQLTGACNSGTASCQRCHPCASHPAVLGGPPNPAGCQNLKCYECHRFSAGGAALRGLRSR